jgi:hypothetical protein
VVNRLLKIGLLTAAVSGSAIMHALAGPIAPPAAPPDAVSIAEPVKYRRQYHEHYHRHYHEHRHYRYGTGVVYGTPANDGEGYNGYRPYYGGHHNAPRSLWVPEFYGLDVAPRFLYPEPRYRIFRDW